MTGPAAGDLRKDFAAELRALLVKIGVAATIALMLLLITPFDRWLVAGWLPALLLATTLVVMARNATRRRRTAAFVVAWTLVIASLAWASVGLLWLHPLSYYTIKDETFSIENIVKGHIPTTDVIQVTNRADASTILVIGDPVRKLVLPWLMHVKAGTFPKELPHRQFLGHQYLVFPLAMAFRYHSSTVNMVFQPTFAPAYELTMLRDKNNVSVRVSASIREDEILHFTPSARPEDPPWNAVEEPAGSDDQIVRYVALLDTGIGEAFRGRDDQAAELLIQASEQAPTAIERARSLCVLSRYFAHVLSGNIGHLQALYLANRAYDTFYDPSLKEADAGWLRRWVGRELANRYEEYGDLFATRLEELSQAGFAVRKEHLHALERTEMTGGAEVLEKFAKIVEPAIKEQREEEETLGTIERAGRRLASMSPQSLRAEFEKAANPYERAMMMEMVVDDVLEIGDPAGKPDDQVAERLAVLEAEVKSFPIEYQDTYVQSIRIQRQFLEEFKREARGEMPRMDLIFQVARDGGGVTNPGDRAFYDMMIAESRDDLSLIRKQPQSLLFPDWWRRDFISQSVRQWLKIAVSDPPPTMAVQVSHVVGDPLRLAVDGTDRPFLPLLFLLAYTTRDDDSTEHRFYVRQLEQTLSIKYLDLENVLKLN